MHRKIRLITTLFTILSLSIIISISLPLAIYAATSANINGSGNLNVNANISIDNQKEILENSGFHVSGTPLELSKMEDPGDNLESLQIYFNNATKNEILKFAIYKKIDCKTQKEILEIQFVFDFSNFSIDDYRQNCLAYYNKIIFANNIISKNDYFEYVRDFTTGDIIDSYTNISTMQLSDGNIYFYNAENELFDIDVEISYAYKIILSSYNNSVNLQNDVFNIMSSSLPNVIYIDIANLNLAIENENVIGITFGGGNTSKDVNLSNIQHIHIVGKNNVQLSVGLYVSKEYILNHNNYEISMYQAIDNGFKILCKANFESSNLVITVIDSKYNGSEILSNEQKEAILNMCYWIIKNMPQQELILYHQLVTENMSFADRYEVTYILDSTKGENWYKVTYVSDGKLIGYFNVITHEIAFE